MTRPLLPGFAILCCYSLLPAQVMLSGIVLDSTDRQPIPFATVYFDGTTNGQTTDEKGQFALPVEGVDLPVVLVVSHISYNPLTLQLDHAASNLTLVLTPRSQTTGTVVVQDRNQREKNLLEFRNLFLGSDSWGKNARIRNEEALVFDRDYVQQRLEVRNDYMRRMLLENQQVEKRWSADGSYVEFDKVLNLKATATAPLIIELPDLGYTLQLDLVSFQVDYEQGSSAYLGYYFFQAQEGTKGQVRPRHQKNREKAYYNSPQHFLRSVFSGTLAENGFRIFQEVREPDNKQTRVELFDLQPFVVKLSDDLMAIRGLNGRKLIVLYYGDAQGRPLPEAKWKRHQPAQSGLHFGEDECFIRADGTIGDSRLLFSGSMGGRGVAWILPADY